MGPRHWHVQSLGLFCSTRVMCSWNPQLTSWRLKTLIAAAQRLLQMPLPGNGFPLRTRMQENFGYLSHSPVRQAMNASTHMPGTIASSNNLRSSRALATSAWKWNSIYLVSWAEKTEGSEKANPLTFTGFFLVGCWDWASCRLACSWHLALIGWLNVAATCS